MVRKQQYIIDNSQLMQDWDWKKNSAEGLDPYVLTCGSGKRAWWKCSICGYEWNTVINNRNYHKLCPECVKAKNGKLKSIPKIGGSLQELFPEIAKEWNYDKNTELTPDTVKPYSNKKVWWRCSKCSHEWESTVNNRVAGRGCGECAKSFRVSFPEKVIYFYIKKYFNNAIWSYRGDELAGMEIDIYIPSLIGIEYDGAKWHQDIERDKKKDDICKQLNIHLIRFREPKCPNYNANCDIICLTDLKFETLEQHLKDILNTLGILEPDVNIRRDKTLIDDLSFHKEAKKSLKECFPQIAAEWNLSKNGNLKPENVSAHSGKLVWWKCNQCGHEWEARVRNRTTHGTGCPKCAQTRITKLCSKPIRCIELNMVFDSCMEAERQTGINHSSIFQCLSEKKQSAGKHQTTGEKLHWEYINL